MTEIDPRTILHDVAFDAEAVTGFNPDRVAWNDGLRFVQMDQAGEGSVALGGLWLVGFGNPLTPAGYATEPIVHPLTEFDDVPDGPDYDHRTIDEQGKGVGPRLYNCWQGLAGLRHRPGLVGAYAFQLDPARRLDLRETQGSSVRQVARHAGRIAASLFGDVRKVVDEIHAGYGDYDAVHLAAPPHPGWRQKARRVIAPVPPEFMIIRNPAVLLYRIGTVRTGW